MKIKKIKYLLLFFIIGHTSCKQFVEIEIPDTQLSSELVFKDVRTAEAALITLYIKMHNSVLVTGDSGGLSVLLGNYVDELTCYNSNLPEFLFYQNELLANNSSIQSIWRNTYNLIYMANLVIHGVENSSFLSQSDQDQLLGEAFFVRAYLHFYLNQLFGNIPYITSTDYRVNTTIGKQTNATLFSMLENDLLRSESLLSDTYNGQYRVRPNKSTALALQARLYLYNERWELAKQKATKVINNTDLYQWVEDSNAIFLRNSTGTIWQLMSAPEGKNTLEAKSFIFTLVPPPNRALNNDFLNNFEPGDLRGLNWIKSVTNGSQTYYHPFKYKLNNDTPTSMEYSVQLRIEEMYLIRAEANTVLGLLEITSNDVNKIRKRAGLKDTKAQTKEELIIAILNERQKEFFCELGHRFFDLKRHGLLNAVLSPVKPGWESTDALFPLPESELLLNPNLLPQNNGY